MGVRPPRTHVDPSPDTVRVALQESIEQERLVTVFGRCRVVYQGRAASTLGPGDRLLVLKPDGTVLVHTDEQQKPVNWQPPGCTQRVTVDDGTVLLVSERSTPEEILKITFLNVAHFAAFDAADTADLTVSGTEADLKERILADPSLLESEFEPRATERETPAGAVDIYGTDSDGNAVVVELKRRRAGPDAVSQLNRYVDALDGELHTGTTVRGILVAPSVTDRARTLLSNRGLEFVSLSPTAGAAGV
jgi:RecB family endonuclease NucS